MALSCVKKVYACASIALWNIKRIYTRMKEKLHTEADNRHIAVNVCARFVYILQQHAKNDKSYKFNT